MVEQADALLDKDNSQLLSGLEDGTVVLATAGGGNVLDAGAGGAEDVVNEGELEQTVSMMSKTRKGQEQFDGENLRKRQMRQPPHPASAARTRALPA